MIERMPDDEKPNPIEDLRKGLGLLFRAAKTTIEKLPKGELEDAVVSGAKEVGRALENVAQAVEHQVLRKPAVRTRESDQPPDAPSKEQKAKDEGEPPAK
jgi:hypothetical protein